MYLDYWGLSKNPFDSVPDPGMYFSSHSTVESTVAELLFAIEEGNECLAVVVGEVGLGKTMSLRVVLNELDPDKYRIAFVTNPDLTFPQLMRELIGQLQGQPCLLRGKDGLLEEFNRILFETADAGRKVLIFIDEGNALRSSCLEGLRLLTNMQEDTRNLLTIVLAGQPKLARMLEDRRRSNLYQRIGVYSHLEELDSFDQVRDYIEYRLTRAGARTPIFSEEAVEAVLRHSDGVPRLINRLCKLSLKAGETNGLSEISGELVEDIASRFDRAARRRYRVRQRALVRESRQPDAFSGGRTFLQPPPESETAWEDPADTVADDASAGASELFLETEPSITGMAAAEAPFSEHLGADGPSDFREPESDVSDMDLVGQPEEEWSEGPYPTVVPETEVPVGTNGHRMDAPFIDDDPGNEETDEDEPAEIRMHPAPKDVIIPNELIDALRSLSDEHQRLRLAGQLAARQIQEHPEHYSDASIDPVRAWDQLRLEILRKVS